MNNYEGLYILNLAGKEDGIKEAIDALEKEITTLGGKVKGVQKMDKRKFERIATPVDSGFYVNVQFAMNPDKLDTLRTKIALNALVFRQMYLRNDAAPEVEAAAPKRKTAPKKAVAA